jgi:hypothetical protein
MLENFIGEFDRSIGMGQSDNAIQPFSIKIPNSVTTGILMAVFSQLPLSTKIVWGTNAVKSESFPVTYIRYDGNKLMEITVADREGIVSERLHERPHTQLGQP